MSGCDFYWIFVLTDFLKISKISLLKRCENSNFLKTVKILLKFKMRFNLKSQQTIKHKCNLLWLNIYLHTLLFHISLFNAVQIVYEAKMTIEKWNLLFLRRNASLLLVFPFLVLFTSVGQVINLSVSPIRKIYILHFIYSFSSRVMQ